MDLEDTLYVAQAGPTAVLDVIYGNAQGTIRTEFMAHKNGFSAKSLRRELESAGFKSDHIIIMSLPKAWELRACEFTVRHDSSVFVCIFYRDLSLFLCLTFACSRTFLSLSSI
jgi:hypothetical protein